MERELLLCVQPFLPCNISSLSLSLSFSLFSFCGNSLNHTIVFSMFHPLDDVCPVITKMSGRSCCIFWKGCERLRSSYKFQCKSPVVEDFYYPVHTCTSASGWLDRREHQRAPEVCLFESGQKLLLVCLLMNICWCSSFCCIH